MSRKIDHKIWENPPHLFGRQPGTRLGKLSRSHRRKRSPLKLKSVDILPKCAISKRLRYEKQIKALHSFRLLSLEMLHRRVEVEKEDFRKLVLPFSHTKNEK